MFIQAIRDSNLKAILLLIAVGGAGVFTWQDPENAMATPLHLACQMNSPVIVEMLLQNGASLQVTDSEGKSPAVYAEEANAKEVLDHLNQRAI